MPITEKDKRHFKRYRRQSNLKLNIAGKAFKAKTIDYSLDGIGAVIEDTPLIAKGAIVDLDIKAPYLHTKGKVVWARKSGSGLMVGIKRLDFPKKGCLDDYPLADILIGLQRSGTIGVLQIESNTIIKKIYIKNGDIIFSTSNQQEDRLGEYLFKTRVLTIDQYKRYVDAIQKSGKKEGAVLVELGYIKPQELPEIVRKLSEEIILSLFGLKGGNFEFKEGLLPSDEVITLKLSAANIIYHGIKRIIEPKRLFDFLQLSMDTILCFSPDPLNLFQDITLDAADRKILSYVDGKNALKDIISLSLLKDTETLKSLYALLSTRIIEVKGEEEIPDGFSAAEVIEEPEVKIDEEFMDKVEGIYSTYETLGYYGVLGIKDWTAPDDIKKAYYKAAKEFHPDRHFRLKSDAVKEKLNAIFSYITAAYATLCDPLKRREYDRLLSLKPAAVVSNQEMARSKFEAGKKEFRNRNYSEAFQLFGQAAYLDNSVAEHHYYYGLALTKLQRFKEAERAINRALKHTPFNADYIAELGHIYLQLGFPHRARSNFERAIKIDPSNKKASEGLARVKD